MKNQQFRTYYFNVPRIDRQHLKVRKEIVQACDVSTSVFYNWIQGLTRIPKHHHETISQVIGKPKTELFPEN